MREEIGEVLLEVPPREKEGIFINALESRWCLRAIPRRN